MTNRDETVLLEELRAKYFVRNAKLLWRRDGRTVKRGEEAGCFDSKGYRVVRHNNKLLKAHRVIFALHYGRWPSGDLDHRNGVRSDNRIRNLREAGRAENMWNRKADHNNKCGVLGVHQTSRGTWIAQLQHMKKKVLRSEHATIDAAIAARRTAERKYFGKFAPSRSHK